MSPLPSSCSAPCSPRMVRLSILLVTWKLMRVGRLALITPVMTSTEGRCVAMIRWMPAARALLREALDQEFDFLAGGHHQVGQLVDDHHDLRQRLIIELFFLVDRLARSSGRSRSGRGGRAACPWRGRADLAR